MNKVHVVALPYGNKPLIAFEDGEAAREIASKIDSSTVFEVLLVRNGGVWQANPWSTEPVGVEGGEDGD